MGVVKEMVQMNPDLLVPYVSNARTHSKEQINKLRASLREFGFVNPIIIDRNNNIIAGHGRVQAAKAEGMKQVPCVYADDLTDAQKKAYILADNRLALDAGWDEELLRIELEELQELDFDLALTGFDQDELDELFKDSGIEEDVEDDGFDMSAALEAATFAKRGDIWTVGRHRLMCGDATSEEDVKVLMDGRVANLIITDPPYGVSFKSTNGLRIKNDNLEEEALYDFLLTAFSNMANVIEKGGVAYIFHADSLGDIFRKSFKQSGFVISQVCIWVKSNFALGRSDYQWKHEPIIYGYLKNGRKKWYSDRKQTTVWNFSKPNVSTVHPTMKPLDLLCYPIRNSSQENAIVLDTFGGSGSTMMACEQINRICYMMELDEKYVSVILRRAVENGIKPEDIWCDRGGEKIPYSDLVKEVELV